YWNGRSRHSAPRRPTGQPSPPFLRNSRCDSAVNPIPPVANSRSETVVEYWARCLMVDPPVHGGSDRALQDEQAAAPGGQNEWGGPDALTALRALLIGPEPLQLSKLQERLDNPQLRAEDISRVLPQAIHIRASKDLQPGRAPMPTVEEELATTASAGPRALVDALA